MSDLRRALIHSAIALPVLGILAGNASAVDGVLEINQACAVNTGCFSGDATGFPVTITAAGSYGLTSNLAVAGSTAIEITSGNVSVELNGFEVRSTDSTGGDLIAANPLTLPAIGVRNGHVVGGGADGLRRDHSIVEDIVARANLGSGIRVGSDSVVRRCNAQSNFGVGIAGGVNVLIEGNVVDRNSGNSIDAFSGLVEGNSIEINNSGIFFGSGSILATSCGATRSTGFSPRISGAVCSSRTIRLSRIRDVVSSCRMRWPRATPAMSLPTTTAGARTAR